MTCFVCATDYPRRLEDDVPAQVCASGFSSGFCTKSGQLYVWGFFKGTGFMHTQLLPRLLPYHDLYVASFSMVRRGAGSGLW